MDQSTREYLQQVVADCVQCGLCTEYHEWEQQTPITYGDIAQRLLDMASAADAQGHALKPTDLPEDIYDFARSCLTCGRCTAGCPVEIRASKMAMTVRSIIVEAMPNVISDYRRYRCDLDDSMYIRMRRVRGTEYEEVLPRGEVQNPETQAPKVLYFQGCTLGNNFPALNKKVYAMLKKQGLATHCTSFCCGRPLMLIGIRDKFENYSHSMCKRMLDANITRVITACPNCYYTLKDTFAREGIADKIELKFLTEILVEAGYRYEPCEKYNYKSVAFHDSCADRHDGTIARSLRTMFENVEIKELANEQQYSICCGSGGFASLYSPTLPTSAFNAGLSDFFDARARCMIVACANCASTFKSSGSIKCMHYLEILFDEPMDMDAYNEALDKLWDPENTEFFLDRFSEDVPFFTC